jgi:DNA-3-methyladenine glycosylase
VGHDRAGRGRIPLAAGRLTLDLEGDPVAAARAIIGWTLLMDGVGGPIVEAEAYAPDDPASHAFRGMTARNAAMFGPAGRLYVYRSYGIHWCVNVVCGPPGVGAAVLVRSLEPVHGIETMRSRRGRDPLATGPGNVGQALGATSAQNGEPAGLHPPDRIRRIETSTRIGITKGVERPWRFFDPDSGAVSRPISSAARGSRRTHA